MDRNASIYVVGGGAIGFSLAVNLKAAGRNVTVLRVRDNLTAEVTQTISVQSGDGSVLKQEIVSRPLATQGQIEGVVIVATKANVNDKLAIVLSENAATSDLIIMQNGIGVEGPFLGKGFSSLSRCVVYITAERVSDCRYTARMVKSSPIGNITGGINVDDLVDLLSTKELTFYKERDINREVWKKGIINTVFNSVCPLLNTDNGIFERDPTIMELAKIVVRECVPVAKQINISIEVEDILDQILAISRHSSGQLISTLQDIRAKRDTEIMFFNFEICRVAESLRPQIELPMTRTLGLLTMKKSEISMESFTKNGGI